MLNVQESQEVIITTLNVCDIANSSSQSVDLNAQLGSHTAGGTWTDDDKSGRFKYNNWYFKCTTNQEKWYL